MSKVNSYRKTLIAVSAVIIVGLLIMGIVGIYLENAAPKDLYPSEVREYQGEDLSSISDVANNAIAGTQQINISTYTLTVKGLVNKTLELSYDQVFNDFQNYKKVVTLHCIEGWSAKILWEGFLVKDLLQQAGADPNATTIIFYASDGYSTALPLEYLTKNEILIAYKMNDIILPPERGFPFELVAESRYGYKWIKWITTIEVSNNTDYLGFWESRGYSNNAVVP
jgi:DMSO/TMAO reductase YedYZ molybdopterin-dependent catalytic subunit